MSKFDELVGYVYGQISVKAYSRTATYAGQSSSFWICECANCGRLIELPRVRITNKSKRIDVCDVCRRGGCWECGKPILSGKTIKRLCSDECKSINVSRRKQSAIAEKASQIADFWQARYQQMKQLHETDLNAKESYKQSQRMAALKYYRKNKK